MVQIVLLVFMLSLLSDCNNDFVLNKIGSEIIMVSEPIFYPAIADILIYYKFIVGTSSAFIVFL